MDDKELSFEVWQKTVPNTIRSEKFWSLIAYQKALYLYDLLWQDTEVWLRDERGQALSKQVIAVVALVLTEINRQKAR
jgi:hypothetical protein